MRIKKVLYILALVAPLSFYALACGSSVQAETMYSISETELTALEKNLETLKVNSQKRQEVLTEQAKLLTEQKAEIKKQGEELSSLKKELTNSKAANEATLKSLKKANEYLDKLEKEEKHKMRVKTRQRNLWIFIAGVSGIVAISK